MPRSLTIAVLLCLAAAPLAQASQPSQANVANLPRTTSVTQPDTSQPTIAPSPPLDALPAPTRRATAAPAMLQVALRSGQTVTFPKSAATAQAITRMATGQLCTRRSRCAQTMREALGWGLGDAHQWLALKGRGFTQRGVKEPAQPGDIVVWAFTFGRRRSQHIGVAVGTDRGPRLLSNLSGSIELSALAPGYRAFYRPVPVAPGGTDGCLTHVYPAPTLSPRLANTTVPASLCVKTTQVSAVPPRI